ncbi:MAG: glycosyltransferase family 9 protein [Candidatus Latescibacteria bacterium]|nr:glycosyltransferase family 9 protein [Candidatus Latescibacterota bacterium]
MPVNKDPQRILILRLSSLGDVILTSAVVGALKKALPGTELFFLTKEVYAPIYDEDPRIEEVIVYPSTGRGLQRLVRVIKDIRQIGFDLVIDLHGTPRSRVIAGLSGARRKVTWKKERFRREWMIRFQRGFVRPVVERYLECAGRGIGRRLTGRPEVVVSDDAQRRIEEVFIRRGIIQGAEVAIVCPGARWATKRWREEGFAEVADVMTERYGYRVLLLGDVNDRPTVERVRDMVKGEAVDLTGELSLKEFVAAIDRASVVVCNDSAPIHIALARGTPVVAIFGPTHPGLGFVGPGESMQVVRVDVPCSPCSLHGERLCRQERRMCMEDVTVEEVIHQVHTVLLRNVHKKPLGTGRTILIDK